MNKDSKAGWDVIADTARRLLTEGRLCDSCLGRAFAYLSTGLSNADRGRAIKVVLSMETGVSGGEVPEWLARSWDFTTESKGESRANCWLCGGMFDEVERWAGLCLRAVGEYEFSSYLVGTRLPGLVAEKEEVVLIEFGLEYAEPMKSELNREVGKALECLFESRGINAIFDQKMPDIVFFLNVEGGEVELDIRPMFIAGRYRKLVRGIPQTHWDCRECRGAGCDKCNYTGKQYPESVEELIAGPMLTAAVATRAVLHGAGREDIDARMLGRGRPFVMELFAPRRRTMDLHVLAAEVNSSTDGKVEVEGLEVADRDVIRAYKSQPRQKVYRIKIKYEGASSTEALKNALKGLIEKPIEQETPQRVVHRRADLIRRRTVIESRLVEHEPPNAVVEITCDGGLYVKELMSGDEGRTNPNMSSLLGVPVSVQELDVMEIKEANHGKVTR